MKLLAAFVFVFVLALPAEAQQPNSANASMTLDGINGPPWPISLPINVATWNPDLTIAIGGPPLRPFILVATPAGVQAAGMPTQFGLVDINLSAGYTILLDGTAPLPAGLLATTDAAGQWSTTVPLWAGASGISTGLQCLMSVPSAPSGFVLTAATFLTTVNVPTSAYFVSHSRGAPGNPGTAGSPFLTIGQGIAAALAAGSPYPSVYVEHGSYTPTGPVSLANGMNIFGGLDPVAWTPVAGTYSTINVGASGISAPAIALPTTIARVEIVAASASLPSAPDSNALRASICTSSLSFTSCRFQAGNAAPGLIGTSPTQTASGGNGSGTGGGSGHPNDGGAGGSGGTTIGGGNGQSGAAGQGPGGAGGASSAGAACGGTADAGNGSGGAGGAHGAGGTAGPVGGTVNSNGSFAAMSNGAGAPGLPGRGGGGGGGSGANSCTATSGKNGGGGGGGGAAGTGGGPGSSGGASIAVTLFDSSPSFQDCQFVSGTGGAGGQGGTGGLGGNGGAYANGGAAGTFVGSGGHGGNGGAGGKGGGGGGGNGGCSFGIAKTFASSPSFVGTNTFSIGLGGAGGPGGIVAGGGGNPGQAGSQGITGNVY